MAVLGKAGVNQITRSISRRVRLLGPGLLPLVISAPVMALDLDITGFVQSEYTNNTARTPTNEIDEWIQQPGLELGLEHESTRVEASASYRYFRRFHSEDRFGDENVTTGTSNFLFRLLPERLDFTVTDARTETPIQSINSASPDNRQETSNTQAGPTLRFPVRGKDEVQVQYLYGNRQSDRTQNDSESHTALARYVLKVDSANSVTFEAIRQEVQFEQPTAPDLKSDIGQLTWSFGGDRLSWEVVGGYKKTQRTEGRADESLAIVDFQGSWKLNAQTQLTLSASRDLRDQSQVLGFGSTEFGQTLRADSDLNEVFRSKRFNVGLSHTFGPNNLTAGALYSEQNYSDVARDVKSPGLYFAYQRKMNRLTDFTLRSQFYTQDYSSQGIEIDEIFTSALLKRRINRRFNTSLGVQYRHREAQELPIPVNFFDYDELSIVLRFDYEFVE